LSQNNVNLREETLRASLYQFIGSVLNSYPDPEQAIAVIMEELTKVVATDEELKVFNTDLIKPMIKAIYYIITNRYDKLLLDSRNTFKDEIPIPVKIKLDNDKQLLALLDSYIKQL
jgi:hypothetical protein